MYKMLIPASLLTLLTATSALAEHKLLVTDMPAPGQVEARVDLSYSRAAGKNGLDENINDEKTGGAATVGVGVIDGLKLSAVLPYTFVQHREGEKIDGFEDIVLGARYNVKKILGELPFEAVIGIDWKLDSASSKHGNPGTGHNSYAPYIAVSKNLHTFTPYVKYQPEFVVVDHQWDGAHNLTAGAEIEFGHNYTLDAKVTGTLNDHTSALKRSTDFEVEVGPYINLVKNLYLLPSVAYKAIGDVRNRAGEVELKNVDEYKLGFGVYYLF
jgi:hypothetical protein